MIRIGLLGAFVCRSLAARIERSVIYVLPLRAGSKELGGRAEQRCISHMSLMISVFRPLRVIFRCNTGKEGNKNITGNTLDNTFSCSCLDFFCLLIASAVRSRIVLGIRVLAIG